MKKLFLLGALLLVSAFTVAQEKIPTWTVQPKQGIVKGDYYKVEERFRQGHLGILEVVKDNGKIVECRYDEIFADSQDEIKSATLKKFYRQSKYWSITYDEPSRIGFNVQMDALNDKVVTTQNLLDITGLPATEKSGNYKKSGFTRRNTAWDNYLKLAQKLQVELEKDNVLK